MTLIESLGGCCVDCGSTSRLELDHIERRTWVARHYGSDQRIALYRRDAADGKLTVRCRRCNTKKGQPPPDPIDPAVEAPY